MRAGVFWSRIGSNPGRSERLAPVGTRAHGVVRRVAAAWTVWLALAAAAAAAGQANAGEEAVLAWVEAGVARASHDSVGAEKLAEARLAEARAAGDRTGETAALIVLAQARGRQNDSAAAHRHSAAALVLAEGLRSEALLLEARQMRAMSHYGADQSAEAIALFLQCLQAAERGRPAKRQPILLGLARCYRDLRDFERALDHAGRALAAAEEEKDETRIDPSVYVLGEIHFARGELAAARDNFARSLEIRLRIGIPSERGDAEVALARIDLREGRPAAALAVLDRVELERRRLRGRWKHTHTLIVRAEALTALGRLDEALADAQRAREFADAIGTPGLLADVYGRLAAVHEARGEAAAALAAARRHFAAEMEARGIVANQQAAEAHARFEAEQKDQQLARLARENELRAAEVRAAAAELARSRTERLAYLGGAAALSALLAVVLAAQIALRRAERRVLAETRAAKDAAEQADRLKGRLLAIASHDLKAPLRSILRGGERIAEEPDNAAAAAEAAALIQGAGLRMFALVRDLIDLAALEQQGLVLQRGPVDLGALAAEVVGEFRAHAEAKSQSLALAAVAAPAPVSADRARLRQVLANLVDNAVKFTPPGGAVKVTVRRAAAAAVLEIADEGPGLTADDLARAFQPFSTLSAQPTGGEASTGLGLHLAHQFTRLHDGELSVRSVPGAGSVFVVSLPWHGPPTAEGEAKSPGPA